jgi:hypothetical protein
LPAFASAPPPVGLSFEGWAFGVRAFLFFVLQGAVSEARYFFDGLF